MVRRRVVVLGTVASDPYAGMAWMHMQMTLGLLRLGHDVHYLETTSAWPYDPVRSSRVGDSDYALPYLASVAERLGLGDRLAYRRSYADGEWLGPARARAADLLASADAVLNVAGATDVRRDELPIGRLVYYGTDPGFDEIKYAQGDARTRPFVDAHDDVVTYAENVGNPGCRMPPLPRLRGRTRQPVLLDLWDGLGPPGEAFTTVANWRQERDVEFAGETYRWSKEHEFRKVIDVPRRVGAPVELACGLSVLDPASRRVLEANGWRLADAHAFSTEPFAYRRYIGGSRGEFTVARDLNVRLATGWFSERSACYLAAGRPVVTQDTGFGCALPTGRGLFAWRTADEAVAALEAIASDPAGHARAAREIAAEFFAAERVMGELLASLGL
jgi:hypothetical protein